VDPVGNSEGSPEPVAGARSLLPLPQELRLPDVSLSTIKLRPLGVSDLAYALQWTHAKS